MRWSEAFIPTLREDPKDAESISHKLMVRAGLIRRLGSGAYSYLPLGVRVLSKVIGIIRDEMNRAGAQECLLPTLQPIELWRTTGREALLGDVLITFKDRTGKLLALGPTHEEVITDLLTEVKSHRQLPLTLYQIQTKFRDEPRPRFGVIRSKEFLMKDAYSFDVDLEGLNRSYQRMYEAYQRIFARCGLTVCACEAESGVMGGDVSHEFMAPAESGEDVVVQCQGCGYAANREAAKCQTTDDRRQTTDEKLKPLGEVETPGRHTVEDVSQFLRVEPSRLIKTLIYESPRGPVAVLIRGDHEVNEAKLMRVLQTTQMKLASPATVERLTQAPVGFTGPMKLDQVQLITDHAVMTVVNGVTGANKADRHLVNVNPGRDFTPSLVADLRVVTPEDGCTRCGKTLRFIRAIEAGHVFKLGTKYSQALGATVQDASGKQVPMVMGCYGIGVNRIVAGVIEQRHDDQGIIWPPSISPFQVLVTVLEAENPTAIKTGEQVVEVLQRAGFEVLFDDRQQSPGSKLKDADLIGVSVQVVIGKVWQTEQRVEVIERASKTRQQLALSNLVEGIDKLLAPTPIGNGGRA